MAVLKPGISKKIVNQMNKNNKLHLKYIENDEGMFVQIPAADIKWITSDCQIKLKDFNFDEGVNFEYGSTYVR